MKFIIQNYCKYEAEICEMNLFLYLNKNILDIHEMKLSITDSEA